MLCIIFSHKMMVKIFIRLYLYFSKFWYTLRPQQSILRFSSRIGFLKLIHLLKLPTVNVLIF